MMPDQQQPTPQQSVRQPPEYQQTTQPLASPEDPGKGLAIAGIILAFFFSGLGLILSIIARSKSSKAGVKNTLATVGIWLNIASIVLMTLLIALIIFIAIPSLQRHQQELQRDDPLGTQIEVKPGDELYEGMKELERTEATFNAKNNAQQIKTRAEAYFTKSGSYPASISDFANYPESTIPSAAEKHVAHTAPSASTGTAAYYQYCSSASAQVLYFNHTENKVKSLGIGSLLNDSPSCK